MDNINRIYVVILTIITNYGSQFREQSRTVCPVLLIIASLIKPWVMMAPFLTLQYFYIGVFNVKLTQRPCPGR